jgi:hypothetical protein
MSTLTLERSAACAGGEQLHLEQLPFEAAHDTGPGDDAAPGGGLTLDHLITSVWEGLAARETVACPACGGEMTPHEGAGACPVGGACRRCDAELS